MNWLIFWRSSLIFWIASFLFVAAMQVFHHSYPHPAEVLLPPIAFAFLSAFQLRREIRNRKISN